MSLKRKHKKINAVAKMPYQSYFAEAIERVKSEQRYRIFRQLTRDHNFPQAKLHEAEAVKDITIWCGVDYLGLSQHPELKTAMIHAVQEFGVGSGGTRNIGGNLQHHTLLEQALAQLHQQEAALLFTSGYVANEATLKTLGQLIPNLTFFSDQQNHMSIIEGIRASQCAKIIFQHNDLHDLEKKLALLPLNAPKIIVFESVYSMSGSIAPMQEIIALAKKYHALTYADEVHAVAVYGAHGGGIGELTRTAKNIDLIQGTLSKGFGLMGGYIAGKNALIDAIRLHANGFIFTTSLPPQIAITALKALTMSKEIQNLQRQLFNVVAYVKKGLAQAGLQVLPSTSQIIPLWIGNVAQCESVSRRLLEEFKIYIQPVNYPTVKKGTERFRISPTARHTLADADRLIAALTSCLL
jgi:5-aminolevulinate synthase